MQTIVILGICVLTFISGCKSSEDIMLQLRDETLAPPSRRVTRSYRKKNLPLYIDPYTKEETTGIDAFPIEIYNISRDTITHLYISAQAYESPGKLLRSHHTFKFRNHGTFRPGSYGFRIYMNHRWYRYPSEIFCIEVFRIEIHTEEKEEPIIFWDDEVTAMFGKGVDNVNDCG